MNVLAIDGAFGGFSVAAERHGVLRAHRRIEGKVALEGGLALILDTMRDADLSPHDLDVLGVGTGPGGFTGLRVAISYAKALALGWCRPLAGVNSFDAMVLGLEPPPELAVISAKAGTASARLRTGGADTRFSGPTSSICDRIARLWTGGELKVTGAPEDVLAGLGERGIVVRTLDSLQPPAVAIARIASTAPRAAGLHAVRADYGESPPAKVPQPR